MVVIAIIGILTSIAMPRFAGVTDSAKVAQIQGNLANLRTAIGMFHAKTGEYPDLSGFEGRNLDKLVVDGNKFTDFYSKSETPKTPAFPNSNGKTVEASMEVYYGIRNRKGKITGFNGAGGWLYISEVGTGEDRLTGDIFANVVSDEDMKDPFNQGVDWRKF